MEMRPWLEWPVYGLLTGPDALARGAAVTSPIRRVLRPRNVTADRVGDSVCSFCAGGCGHQVCAGFASPQQPYYVVAPQQVRPDPAVPDHEGRRR
jgi:hypothetical protein